jgi:hypothetical protein
MVRFELIAIYYYGAQINEGKIGRACCVHGGRRRILIPLWWGNLTERDHRENLGADGSALLKLVSKK